jgi:Tol biopolymer transport system component
MSVRRVILAIPLVVFAAIPVALHAETRRPMSFVDMIDMPLVQDPQLSPDGKRVAFVMFKSDWRANRPIGHIYRIDADGTNQVQLTFGERGESTPRWSPDGTRIAFVARRETDAASQVYLLDTSGGDARRLTTHPTAPGAIQWAPDGLAMYFTATDARSAEEREKDRLQDDVYAFEETNFKQRHLWSTDLDGKTRKLTDGDYSVGGYEVSMDGTKVVVSRAPSPLLEHNSQAEVWVMDRDGSNARQLTRNTVLESDPSLSPDNSMVVFRAGANAQFEGYYSEKIFVVPASGGAARLLVPDATYEVLDVQWAGDGKSVYFLANMGVHTELFNVDVGTAQVTQLTDDEHAIAAWTYGAGARTHVFTRNTPRVRAKCTHCRPMATPSHGA